MSHNPRDLRRRITSIETTVSITRAMKTVSSVRLRQARALLEPAREFVRGQMEIWQLASDYARSEALGASRVSGNTDGGYCHDALYALLTSDRGLAGAYNSQAIKAATDASREASAPGFISVGRVGQEVLKSRGTDTFAHFPFSGAPEPPLARHIANLLVHEWNQRRARSYVVYTRFESALGTEPVVIACVPPPEPEAIGAPSPIWEPSESETLLHLLPRLVTGTIYMAMVESWASELASRVLAMEQATEKAEDLLEELTHVYHKIRRERITRELVEAAGRGSLS